MGQAAIQTLCVQAFPKINAALKIGAKRGNLHTIQSRFCLIQSDIYDTMLFVKLPHTPHHATKHNRSDNGESALLLSGNFDCQMEQNLITKAYHALLNHAKTQPKQIHQERLHIKDCAKIQQDITPHTLHIMVAKQIPTGGGLGGGSANAAITLLALNELLGLHYDMPTLCALAKTLGSDIAFFLIVYAQNGTQIAPYFALRDSLTQDEIEKYTEYFVNHGEFPNALINALNEQKSGHSLRFVSANVFGIGDEIMPFYEELPKIHIHCNQIACNTAAVYGEFARLRVYSVNQGVNNSVQKSVDSKQDSQCNRDCGNTDSRDSHKRSAQYNNTLEDTQYDYMDSQEGISTKQDSQQNNVQCDYIDSQESGAHKSIQGSAIHKTAQDGNAHKDAQWENTHQNAQSPQTSIDWTQDSATLLRIHTSNFLNDLYAPACNLYPLQQIEEELRTKYGRVYFSGSGSSFFSVEM